jgi:hypothetical protein
LFWRAYCTTGEEVTFRQVVLSRFADNLPELLKLKNLDPTSPNYKERKNELKGRLQCFTPAASLQLREKGNTVVKERTGLLQLDFDNVRDVESLKKQVFQLPFIAYCSVSCSGQGFYALAAIAEPEKLSQYGEHLFHIFKKYGVRVDTTKGRNESDLRFVHYDCNMMIRDHPKPLQLLDHSYRQPPKTFPRLRENVFKMALNAATNKYGSFAEGNRHNFIWLACKTLAQHGVARSVAENFVSTFYPLEKIKSNCISSAYK